MELDETEKQVQLQLKQLCDSQGVEIEPKETTILLNTLGLHCQTKSFHKISLIHSAALLNAGLVRQPSNREFQDNSRGLCKHMLNCVKSIQKDSNLIDFAFQAAVKVNEMRKISSSHQKTIRDLTKNTPMWEMEYEYMRKVNSMQTKFPTDYIGLVTLCKKSSRKQIL